MMTSKVKILCFESTLLCAVLGFERKQKCSIDKHLGPFVWHWEKL